MKDHPTKRKRRQCFKKDDEAIFEFPKTKGKKK
jgi:hypothetical protein